MSNIENYNNNNRRINFLTEQIGQQKKNILQKVTTVFKKSKSKEVLEILERKLLNFIDTLTFENLEKKIIELINIYERINNIHEKILAKKDNTLQDRCKVILENYVELFPKFSDKILVLLNSHDLDINNLMYLSFIIDNLIAFFIKKFQPFENNPNYIKMLGVQTKIFDKVTNKKSNKTNSNINLKNIENEQNEYMLREKILTLSLKIYKKALTSQGVELEKLKIDFEFLINLYKEKFINSRKKQHFPINQNTLVQFDFLYKSIQSSNININNSNLAAELAKLSFNTTKK